MKRSLLILLLIISFSSIAGHIKPQIHTYSFKMSGDKYSLIFDWDEETLTILDDENDIVRQEGINRFDVSGVMTTENMIYKINGKQSLYCLFRAGEIRITDENEKTKKYCLTHVSSTDY